MTSIKDMWGKFTAWASGTANTVVSANVSVVVDPVVNTATKVVHTVENTASDVAKKVDDVYHNVTKTPRDVLTTTPPAPKKPKKPRKKKD